MTNPDQTPIDGGPAAGWRSGPGLSGLQSMHAAASLNLDAALDQSGPDQQADDDTAEPTALGVRRRLRALTARSWSPQAIADQTGIPAPLISSQLGGNRRNLSPDQRLAIANAYDKIWKSEPPADTLDQREARESARSLAASRGWAPPQAWDDAQIDQPDGLAIPGLETPQTHHPPCRRHRRRRPVRPRPRRLPRRRQHPDRHAPGSQPRPARPGLLPCPSLRQPQRHRGRRGRARLSLWHRRRMRREQGIYSPTKAVAAS